MKTKMIQEAFKRGGELQTLLLRHTRSLISQISQTAVCNCLHTVEERLTRWLLMSHDRAESDELPFTQEFLAHMLGVRRAGVNVTARTLQEAGLIHYNRGHIIVLNREGLESAACECYGIVKEEYDRFLGV